MRFTKKTYEKAVERHQKKLVAARTYAEDPTKDDDARDTAWAWVDHHGTCITLIFARGLSVGVW